jgi:hypothetical protein
VTDPQYGVRQSGDAPTAKPKQVTWNGPTWFLATFLLAVPVLTVAIPLCVFLVRLALGG